MNIALRTLFILVFINNMAQAQLASSESINQVELANKESKDRIEEGATSRETQRLVFDRQHVYENSHVRDQKLTEKDLWEMIANLQAEIDDLKEVKAYASMGDGAGNGGGAWICEYRDHIKWMQLIDLFEVRAIPANILDFREKSLQEIFELQLERLTSISQLFVDDLKGYFEKYFANKIMLDAAIVYVDDAPRVIAPETRNNCDDGIIRYVQIANYTNDGDILVNNYLYNHSSFSPTDRAALIFHEVIYSYLRSKFQDENSVRARKITGLIFSDLDNELIAEKINKIVDLKFNDFPKLEAPYVIPAGAAAPQFVRIPKGSFIMGDERSKREVTISKDFEIMTTEVTQLQWFLVMGYENKYMNANPSRFRQNWHCTNNIIIDGRRLCPNHPVEQVSRRSLDIFINKLNEMAGEEIYRLPTEAEWEYAARGGSSTRFFFGDDDEDHAQYSWNELTTIFSPYIGDEKAMDLTYPVGRKKPNQYGLYDVYGNVWEWVADRYIKNPRGGIDPIYEYRNWSSSNIYVIRGGGVRNGSHADSSYRHYQRLENWDTGFRLVRMIK